MFLARSQQTSLLLDSDRHAGPCAQEGSWICIKTYLPVMSDECAVRALGFEERLCALQSLLGLADHLRGLRKRMQEPLSRSQAAALDTYFARTVEASGTWGYHPACANNLQGLHRSKGPELDSRFFYHWG